MSDDKGYEVHSKDFDDILIAINYAVKVDVAPSHCTILNNNSEEVVVFRKIK